MTLIEIVLAVVLVAVVAVPMWDLLVSSRTVTASAEELSKAVTIASNGMAKLRALPADSLQELPETEDEQTNFGFSKPAAPYRRFIVISDTGIKASKGNFKHARVIVRWQSKRVKRELDYTLEALLQ